MLKSFHSAFYFNASLWNDWTTEKIKKYLQNERPNKQKKEPGGKKKQYVRRRKNSAEEIILVSLGRNKKILHP